MTSRESILQDGNIPSPCFILDVSLFERNLEVIENVQKLCDVRFLCALKGFAFHKVFPMFQGRIHGASASSVHEAMLIREKAGIPVHSYLPSFTSADIETLSPMSSHLVFNSWGQYNDWSGRVRELNPECLLGIRVNPEYSEVATDLYNPSSPDSRLGVRLSEMPKNLPDGITGLHLHALCEQDSFVLERLLEKFTEEFGHYLDQVSWLNLGGGHLVTAGFYDDGHLKQVIEKLKSRFEVDVYMEPGSAFAWETGYLLSTVTDVLEREPQNVAMLDVSFTCHMPDCLEMPYKPRVFKEGSGAHRYILGGSSCLAGDQIGGFAFEGPLEKGDRILFEDMIHYTMVKTTNFNGIALPHIGLIDHEGRFELVRSFGYAEYRDRLS